MRSRAVLKPWAFKTVACCSPSASRMDAWRPPFGFQNSRLLFTFGPVDLGLPLTLGFGNIRRFNRGGGFLPLHRLLDPRRRVDLVDFNLRNLDAPARGFSG